MLADDMLRVEALIASILAVGENVHVADALAHFRLAMADEVDAGHLAWEPRFDRIYLAVCLNPPAQI